MQEKREIEVLVVGLGLAGIAIAETFRSKGKSVVVIDEKRPDSSSRVAAGLWNPVAFRKMKQAWRAEEFFPIAEAFYTRLEKQLNTKFWHEKGIARIFNDSDEAARWEVQKKEAPFDRWMMEEAPNLSAVPMRAPNGVGALHKAGYLETETFLEAYRNALQEEGFLLEEPFFYDALQVKEDGVVYHNIEAKFIVFCEGPGVLHNPWFYGLEHHHKKGEILTIKNPNLPLDIILNKSLFLMPLGNDLFRLGSTFNWNEVDRIPTEKAKKELLDKAAKFISLSPTIVDHKAGLRPSSKDRKPIVGRHEKHPCMLIFNGMAARGVTQAPPLALHLYEHLYENKELTPEVLPYRKMVMGGAGVGSKKSEGKLF